jgi:16S rRNA (uracil1498-N3)-methyltransferase
MQFIYHENSGDDIIIISDDTFRHIFKSRRENSKENKFFRNLKDNFLYEYENISIDKKSAQYKLVSKEETSFDRRFFHIGWCVIDPKSIEKTLPFLNELGVSKISFVYCSRSQKKYKIDESRINKILINSCCQCNRIDLIDIEILDSFDDYIEKYPDSFMLNFSDTNISSGNIDDIESILIGCEGGFVLDEISKLEHKKVLGLNIKNILKSETAVVAVASKILG